jgi:hypothetical protein
LAEHHGKVRLTLEGGQRLTFDSVWVARDSVYEFGTGDTTAVSTLSDVAGADARKANTGATIGLAIGGGVAAFLVTLLAICAADGEACEGGGPI